MYTHYCYGTHNIVCYTVLEKQRSRDRRSTLMIYRSIVISGSGATDQVTAPNLTILIIRAFITTGLPQNPQYRSN